MPRGAAPLIPALLLAALPVAAAAQVQLQRGYYIDAATPCAQASNATLTLVHRSGINASRVACEFTSVTPSGPDTYAFTESCTEIGSSEPFTNAGTIVLMSPTRYRVQGEGWQAEMNHCPQPALPEPWRSNDISDLVN